MMSLSREFSFKNKNRKEIFIRKESVWGALDYLSPEFDLLISIPF